MMNKAGWIDCIKAHVDVPDWAERQLATMTKRQLATVEHLTATARDEADAVCATEEMAS